MPIQLMAAFFPGDEDSPTVVMGTGKGSRPQELAEKRLRPQKMQGAKPRYFLMMDWHRYCQESVAKTLSLKTSFSPKEYTGTKEALGKKGNKEEGWLGQQLLEYPKDGSPREQHNLILPLPKPFKANDNGYYEKSGKRDSHFLRKDCVLNLHVYISSSSLYNQTIAR